MRYKVLFYLLVTFALPVVSHGASAQPPVTVAEKEKANEVHTAWVAEQLKRMLTIKPGMTRRELLAIMTTEGGLSTRFGQKYVSRDCPYFKIDVEFQPVGPPYQDRQAQAASEHSDDDVIVKVSTPYLEFGIRD